MSFPLHKRRKTTSQEVAEQARQASGDWAVLKVSDRCDRCDSQAYVFVAVRYVGGKKLGSLMFCGHHAHAHWDALARVAVLVVDERYRLTQ